MQRIAVIAKLKEGAAERAHELLAEGPPFDPDALGNGQPYGERFAAPVIGLFPGTGHEGRARVP